MFLPRTRQDIIADWIFIGIVIVLGSLAALAFMGIVVSTILLIVLSLVGV
jgi:hypothetical protein